MSLWHYVCEMPYIGMMIPHIVVKKLQKLQSFEVWTQFQPGLKKRVHHQIHWHCSISSYGSEKAFFLIVPQRDFLFLIQRLLRFLVLDPFYRQFCPMKLLYFCCKFFSSQPPMYLFPGTKWRVNASSGRKQWLAPFEAKSKVKENRLSNK